MAKRPGRIQRFLRWLFGSPFENISDVIGDPVPPELRAFEGRVDAMQHHPEAKVAIATVRSERTKSA